MFSGFLPPSRIIPVGGLSSVVFKTTELKQVMTKTRVYQDLDKTLDQVKIKTNARGDVIKDKEQMTHVIKMWSTQTIRIENLFELISVSQGQIKHDLFRDLQKDQDRSRKLQTLELST